MEVVLRKRKGLKKTSLSLAIWRPELRQWTYEPLKLFLYPIPADAKPELRAMLEAQNKESEDQAKTKRSKRYLEINAEQDGEISSHNRQEDFITFFADLADKHDKNWKQAARVLREYCKGPVSFRALNGFWLEGFQKYLEKNYNHNWGWLLQSRIRAGLKQALRERRIPKDICVEVKPIPYKKKKKVFLTAVEIQQLAKTPFENHELKRAFLFSCFSGLRYSDICALTWRNIDGEFLDFEQIKTGEDARIPLHPNAKQILFENREKVINLDEKVFKMLSNTRVNQLVKIWARRAGIQKLVTFHTGRHTCGFLNLDDEVSIYDLQKIMGHSKLATTEDYAHQHAEGLRKRLAEKVHKINLKIG
jgi:integrase